VAVVALLQPGAMGARVGGELVTAGHEVRWLPAGRSHETEVRAGREGLTSVADVAALVDGADVVLSLLPPQAAVVMARLVAAADFTGTYVDANPLGPGTLAEVRETVEGAGAVLVDAGVVGPPPREGHHTHLYLSGDPDRVAAIEQLVAGTRVEPVVVGTVVGQASAAKQAYALFNKGRMVLASLAADLADAHGVRQVLAAERHRRGAELLGELDDLGPGLAGVGWRWGPEMDELALALEDAGVDPSTVRAMAARLRRLAV
jgi:3-hydroxyisobutyrate dehydrogenase-like beta-hydroxyacid dehydrogenase